MKKILIFIATIGILITSCNKNDMTIYRNGDINVTIQGTVYDNNGKIPLSGVTVSVQFDGKTMATKTDTNGIYTLKNFNSGIYNLNFSLNGYGTILQTINANPINYTGNHYVASLNASLKKFDQTLSTRIVIPVLYDVETTVEYMPAGNMPVTIYLDSSFVNNKINDTTDINGFLTVRNLPKDPVRLVINNKNGNYHSYIGSSPNYSIVQYPMDFFSRYLLTQENTALFYLISTNILDASNGNSIKNFVNGSSIKFNFSTGVDLTYSDMMINLYKIDYETEVAVAKAVTWSGGSCTIDPLGTTLDTSANYMVELKLKSTAGIYYPYTYGYSQFNFKVQRPNYSLAQVSGFTLDNSSVIDSFTTSVLLDITTVANAEKYSVYGQYGTRANEYLYLGTYPAPASGNEVQALIDLTNLSGISYSPDGLFSHGAIYSLIVRAERNDGSFGPFSSVLALKK